MQTSAPERLKCTLIQLPICPMRAEDLPIIGGQAHTSAGTGAYPQNTRTSTRASEDCLIGPQTVNSATIVWERRAGGEIW